MMVVIVMITPYQVCGILGFSYFLIIAAVFREDVLGLPFSYFHFTDEDIKAQRG